jgi:hypothetical protein
MGKNLINWNLKESQALGKDLDGFELDSSSKPVFLNKKDNSTSS